MDITGNKMVKGHILTLHKIEASERITEKKLSHIITSEKLNHIPNLVQAFWTDA